MENSDKYDVVLSFAGEDRRLAEELHNILSDKGLSVFYDMNEQASLWGKDLYQHLQEIYRDKGQFCVIFVSKHYSEKLWTKHELKNAQARAFKENREYILPVILDDTEIPGLNSTVGYIDLRQTTISDVANKLIEKLSVISNESDSLEKKTLNNEANILTIVPLYNKAEDVYRTLNNLVEVSEQGNKVCIINDYSKDASYKKVNNFINQQNLESSFFLRNNKSKKGKISAIKEALELCGDTEYILLLDADSTIDLKNKSLKDLTQEMEKSNYDIMAFTVSPYKPLTFLQKLQQVEYSIITSGLREFIGVVTCISGAGSLWKKSVLIDVLQEHSGLFEGDDLEATIIASIKNYKISFSNDVELFTQVPNTWEQLFSQRYFSWEKGFWRCSIDLLQQPSKRTWLLNSKTPSAAHFRGILIIEVLMHPIKILTFLLFAHQLIRLFETKPIYLTKLSNILIYGIVPVIIMFALYQINKCTARNWKQRVALNSWLIGYLLMPMLSFVLVLPFIPWFKEISGMYPEIGKLVTDQTVLDKFQYMIVNTTFILTFFLWWVVTLFLVIKSKHNEGKVLSLFPYILALPFYQMTSMVIIRTASLLQLFGKFLFKKVHLFFT